MFYNNIVEIDLIIILLIGSFLIKRAIIFADQSWVKTFSNTATIYFLPIIVYFITKAISGNIALSLGMIGALSIVRFRHPVKSALELVIYFALITIGIAASVRTKWAIQLIICTILIILIVKIVQIIFKKFGRSFYNVSFNEGNINNSLEIVSKKRINSIEKSEYLVSYLSDIDNSQYIYRLNFANKTSLEDFRDNLKSENDIEKINVVLN